MYIKLNFYVNVDLYITSKMTKVCLKLQRPFLYTYIYIYILKKKTFQSKKLS